MGLLRRAGVLGPVLLAACLVVSVVDAATAAPSTTQAGCACLSNWKDAAGVLHTGCANPNNDPLGDWCAVDPSACMGYYSSFVDQTGGTRFFDYCGDARERTSSGCLCTSDWSVDGAGKVAYHNRCAQPAGETGARTCLVDFGTCPAGKAPSGGFDACGAGAGGSSAGAPTPSNAESFHGCDCVSGWWYEPSPPAGGARKQLSGCANPDGDSLGAWCPVDPEACAKFAGYVHVDASNLMAFDYCDAEPPAMRAKDGTCRGPRLSEWAQCGGKGNCTEWGCADADWRGACCGDGLACERLNAYYYQCRKPGSAATPAAGNQGSGTPAAGAAAVTSTEVTGSGATPSLLVAGAVTTPSMDKLPALSAGLTSLQASAPGQAVYVKLRLDHSFDLVKDNVGAQAQLKVDLIPWLKASAADEAYIYSAAVDAITNGSIVVYGNVVLTSDAPANGASAALTRMQGGAADLYKASALPATWGSLLSFEASNVSLAPQATTATSRTSVAAAPGASSSRLSAGAIAGIAIGAVAFVLILLGVVVWRGLQMNKARDADKSAQLAYMNEMTEADLEGEEEEEEEAAAKKDIQLTKPGAAKLPTSVGATSTGGSAGPAPHMAMRPISAAPDAAFLPLPDGEAARRSSAGGIAYASLKQRRVSGSGSASGGGGDHSGALAASPSGAALARASGASGSGFFSVALSKLGSSVSHYTSGGGSSEGHDGKDH